MQRWELNERRDQLSILLRLKADLERQYQLLSGYPDGKYVDRREHLTESLEQIDLQIAAARADIDQALKAMRLIEERRMRPERLNVA
jgi:hypothetical protein